MLSIKRQKQSNRVESEESVQAALDWLVREDLLKKMTFDLSDTKGSREKSCRIRAPGRGSSKHCSGRNMFPQESKG